MRMRPVLPWAPASAGAELLGGWGLAVGFLTPLPSFAIAVAALGAPKTMRKVHEGNRDEHRAVGIHLPEPWTLIVVTILTVGGVAIALVTRTPQEATA
jgi:uncharacterized membrane protein YphA (DoxX/SURF4 family)